MIELNPKIAEEIGGWWPQTQDAIKAGRCLFFTAKQPHLGGFWSYLQEFAQILNRLNHNRKISMLRILVTYENEAEK